MELSCCLPIAPEALAGESGEASALAGADGGHPSARSEAKEDGETGCGAGTKWREALPARGAKPFSQEGGVAGVRPLRGVSPQKG